MADVVASTQRTRQDNTENTSKCCVKCFIKYKIWHSPLVKGYGSLANAIYTQDYYYYYYFIYL